MNTHRRALVRSVSALFHDWWNSGEVEGLAVAERGDWC